MSDVGAKNVNATECGEAKELNGPLTRWRSAAQAHLARRRLLYNPHRPPSRLAAPRYPDFYIIGPHKTGTTWLYEQLQMHPQIWSPIVKEVLYFSEFWIERDNSWILEHRRRAFLNSISAENLSYTKNNDLWSEPHIEKIRDLLFSDTMPLNDLWYSNFFDECGIDQLCYDASATYVMLPRAALAHMRRLSQHGRIILILRDPVARIWSFMRMRMRDEKNESIDFQKSLIRQNQGFFYWSSNYCEIKRKYTRTFGDENVLVLNYDHIRTQPLVILQEICDAVGIDYIPDIFYNAGSTIFEGPSMTMPAEIHSEILALLGDLREQCEAEFPDIASGWAW
jgi:Sulfotransferase family